MPLLFLLFIAIPMLEIYLLIQVGGVIGALPTVALVVLTAVVGVTLLRLQGVATLMRVRETLARGEVPALEMLEGVVLLAAGAFLLTPGFFTDALGFLALIPPLRRAVVLWLIRRGGLIVQGGFHAHRPHGPHGHHDPGTPRGPTTIEGEFRREERDGP